MTSSNIASINDDPCFDTSFLVQTSELEQARMWLREFVASISAQDIDSLISLFHEHGFWKDILTLTWDLRTIQGHPSIRRLLDARLAVTGLSAFHLLEDERRGPTTTIPYPGQIFIRFCFTFETNHGKGISVAYLSPTPNHTWRAWSLLTRLESLKAYPEKIGALRVDNRDSENWEERRRREIDFDHSDPTVLVIGAGHSGLSVAARLTCLGVPTLIIDRQQRVGDNWRMRYDTLRLHDTVWLDQMPYLDYPKTWPVYCPGSKVGDWLEFYASALDLNVWLRSSITSTQFDQKTKTWKVSIDRDGKLRTMRVNHVVFATGYGGGFPKMPDIPGKELYHGSVLHSSQFTSATDHEGQRVIVVGSGTSAHDIAHDLSRHGCQVTMVQRSPTYVISQKAFELLMKEKYNDHFPIEFADVLSLALPFATVKRSLQVSVAMIANNIDNMKNLENRELLDNLTSAGFQTYLGPDGAGALLLIFQRGGGFYIETGGSQEIIRGNIKVQRGSVRRFTERGVELEDDSRLEADLVVFATGFGDIRGSIVEVCGPDVAAKVGKVWGLDAEGEMHGVWRRTGHPRLWIAMGKVSPDGLPNVEFAFSKLCSFAYALVASRASNQSYRRRYCWGWRGLELNWRYGRYQQRVLETMPAILLYLV